MADVLNFRTPFDIAVCICTFERYELLANAIESIVAQEFPEGRLEIIVVDNSPDPARAKMFQAKFSKIANLNYLIESAPGLSRSRNAGVAAARAPLIAFIDDDAIASPNWASEICRAFADMGARAAVVGGRVDPIWSAPRPPWLHDSMLGSLSVVNWGGELRVAASNEWVAGANLAFRVASIREQGGFSLKLGRTGSGATLLSNEETELIARIAAAGGELVYAPEAQVRHLVDSRRLTQTWFRKRAAWQASSDFLLAPDAAVEEAKAGWPTLLKYFNALPPLERTVRGLLYETDDPELFRAQIGAVYTMTKLLLAGFEGTELV